MLQLDERLDANSPDSSIYIRARWLGRKLRTCRCDSDADADADSDADSDAVSISDSDRCSDPDTDGICFGECFANGEGPCGPCAVVGIG